MSMISKSAEDGGIEARTKAMRDLKASDAFLSFTIKDGVASFHGFVPGRFPIRDLSNLVATIQARTNEVVEQFTGPASTPGLAAPPPGFDPKKMN